MHRTQQKPKDFFIQNDDGSITDLKTHNTTRALDLIWKSCEAKMRKFAKMNKATMSVKEREVLKEQLITALGNAKTLKEYTGYRKIQEPEEINQMITAYFVWIKSIQEFNSNDPQGRTKGTLSIPMEPAAEEDEIRRAGSKSNSSTRSSKHPESPKDNNGILEAYIAYELGVGGLGIKPLLGEALNENRETLENTNIPTEATKRDAGIRALLEGALPKKTVTLTDWSRGSSPAGYSGIETIHTEFGDRDAEDRFNRTSNQEKDPSTRGPRTSTFNIKRESEASKIGDMTFKDLSQMIQNIMIATQAATIQNQAHNYTISPRPKYHHVDLKSFSGRMEDYPAWRQNLEISGKKDIQG